jgi:arylsulfatase A-like enzyme
LSKSRILVAIISVLILIGLCCSGPDSDQPILTAEIPLHLEEHLDDARIEGSEVSEDLTTPVVWDFSEPQPAWEPIKPIQPQMEAVKPVQIDGALRLPLTTRNRVNGPRLLGRISVELPDWNIEEWAYVEIQARASDGMRIVGLGFNYTENDRIGPKIPFYSLGDRSPLVSDGTVQIYRLSLDNYRMRKWDGPWTDLGIWFNSQDNEDAVTLDILSVSVIPKEHIYADAPIGIKTVKLGETLKNTLFTHASGRIEYRVQVPQAGRLDVGLGVLKDEPPVTFRIIASQTGKEETTLFEEICANRKEWHQRSIDLANMAGQSVKIALETDAVRAGTVAFWGAPTISGARMTKKPNIIFYVIDGAGADWMSVYGYNRRTTPFLEELAREGALFEHAYSTATWTKMSNPSFMTSLYYSVLGGYRTISDKIPEGVTTMAEHFGRANYGTAVITSNPAAATFSGLERGVDTVQMIDPPVNSESSQGHHRAFWKWREAYPGEPYWVHFQTTDVHEPFRPTAPFSGLFITPEQRAQYIEWDDAIWEAGNFQNPEAYAQVGTTVEQHALAQQALYDEGMAHQDYQLRRFVERLRATGEWENTIFIVASDHGYPAGSHRFNPGMAWDAPYIHSFATRVPLMFVWPGRIQAGTRFPDPVSMVDVLPTILELAGLPMPEMMQGQSLVPLLLGEGGWQPKPVIVDMLTVEQTTGKLVGSLEMIDGRWGASLVFNEITPGEAPLNRSRFGDGLIGDAPFTRDEPLLIYDLWDDPLLTTPINAERPDLMEKYRMLLEEQFKANEMLREMIGSGGAVKMTSEQLERLRTLGYIK